MFVFFDSCLLLTPRIRILWASLNSRTRDIRILQLARMAPRRMTAEHDRNWSFRQFRPPQIPRNTPECRSMRTARKDRPLSPCDRRLNPHASGPAIGAYSISPVVQSRENSMKQGAELMCGFQFHLPPVFRPSRSASLSLPRSEGREENGAADETTLP